MVNAAGLLQISLSCECWGTAKLVFDNACTCQGTVVDLFTSEWMMIPQFRKNTFDWFIGLKQKKTPKQKNPKQTRKQGWKCECIGDASFYWSRNQQEHETFKYRHGVISSPNLHLTLTMIHSKSTYIIIIWFNSYWETLRVTVWLLHNVCPRF